MNILSIATCSYYKHNYYSIPLCSQVTEHNYSYKCSCYNTYVQVHAYI